MVSHNCMDARKIGEHDNHARGSFAQVQNGDRDISGIYGQLFWSQNIWQNREFNRLFGTAFLVADVDEGRDVVINTNDPIDCLALNGQGNVLDLVRREKERSTVNLGYVIIKGL